LREAMEASTPEGLSSLSKDGIHPTQEGHRVAAEAIAPYVLPLLEQ
jgi:lysophospholipase L1-like esterase